MSDEIKVEEKKVGVLTQEELDLIKNDPAPAPGYQNIDKDFKKPEAKEDAKSEESQVEPKKEAEEPKEELKPEPDDPFTKLERELAKPEGDEDLKDFSKREQAYFYQMRRDRKKRQKAEEERDAALFREAQRKREEEQKKAQPEPKDPFDGRDDDEYLTVAEAKKLRESLKEPIKQESRPDPAPALDPVRTKYLDFCEKEAKAEYADFDLVMSLSDDILRENAEYIDAVGMALMKGENPAKKAYLLIKSDPEFEKLLPVAQAKTEAKAEKKPLPEPAKKSADDLAKEAQAKKAQEALEKNRTKTTANVSSAEEKSTGELTLEDIAQMPDREFAKLPKKLRDKYLKKYG